MDGRGGPSWAVFSKAEDSQDSKILVSWGSSKSPGWLGLNPSPHFKSREPEAWKGTCLGSHSL